MTPIGAFVLGFLVVFIIGYIIWLKSQFDFEDWINDYSDDTWD